MSLPKWKPSHRFYRGCYNITWVLFGIVFWSDIKGREKIPTGAAMICSNHSSFFDPIFIAFAFGKEYFLHFFAKVELFRVPVLSWIITKLGAISVDRDMFDVTSMKRTLSYFKNGEKVAIFPEGTRAADLIESKKGAVKIAERAHVPLVPVFVPRKKKCFSKLHLVIGEPYYIEKQANKRTAEDYHRLSEELMAKIEALNPVQAQ
ncbi:MAG: 1-acyl-sn-glycerol-3-phosphate acyltransferase [Oscillospiraceae bacterium]|nr:1-acyl-sn-glycerol-3-phosphate acyltransferase [Oscillospiraceae bacterium]